MVKNKYLFYTDADLKHEGAKNLALSRFLMPNIATTGNTVCWLLQEISCNLMIQFLTGIQEIYTRHFTVSIFKL